MTTNDIMEQLSRDFILTIAHNKGYFNSESADYGTDLLIRKAKARKERTKNRYLTSGKAIDVQLKAVSEDWITYLSSTVKYVLEVKNYNDLVERANEGGSFIPLILIVFVLPSDSTKWVESTVEGVISRKEAYWYYISPDSSKSQNQANITIEIPRSNKVNTELFPNLFSTLWD